MELFSMSWEMYRKFQAISKTLDYVTYGQISRQSVLKANWEIRILKSVAFWSTAIAKLLNHIRALKIWLNSTWSQLTDCKFENTLMKSKLSWVDYLSRMSDNQRWFWKTTSAFQRQIYRKCAATRHLLFLLGYKNADRSRWWFSCFAFILTFQRGWLVYRVKLHANMK